MTSKIACQDSIVILSDDSVRPVNTILDSVESPLMDDLSNISPLSFPMTTGEDEKVSLGVLSEGTVSCANGVAPFTTKGKTCRYFNCNLNCL